MRWKRKGGGWKRGRGEGGGWMGERDGGRGRRDWVSAERNGSTEEEQEKKTNLNR